MMRVLIVLMGAIGDVVRGLPVATTLKAHRPDCRITWLVEPPSAPIVRAVPAIDDVIVFERARGLRAIPGLVRQLRERKFDVSLDLQRHFKSGVFTYLARAPIRVGFHRSNTKEGNFLFNNRHIPPASEEAVAKFDQYLEFLKAIEIPVAGIEHSFGLSGRTAPPAIAELLPPRHSYVALVVGSRWPSKDWPLQGYHGLIQRLLAETDASIVLVGGPDRVADGEKLCTLSSDRRVVNLIGKTSLLDLCPIFEGAKAVVGPDSGPAHLAAAVGAPHITIFGPTRPRRTAPYRSEHLTLQANLGCIPCYQRECPGLNTLCMRLVSVNSVFEMVHPFLSPEASGLARDQEVR